jgi:hypothetical protein
LGKDGRVYLDSAKAALGCVAKQYVKVDADKKQSYVFTVDPRQDVLATAMFALAASVVDANSNNGKDIVTNMLSFLRSRIDKQGRFVDAEGKPLDDVSSAVALFAIQTLTPNPKDEPWRDGVEALLYDSGLMGATGEKTKPLSAVGLAWLGRAILAGGAAQYQNFILGFATRIFQSQQQYGAPSDEVGAVCTAAGTAETLPTALTAILMYQAIQQKGFGLGDVMNHKAAKSMNGGFAFCRQMMYRPEEAYFAPSPSAWRGAVRRRADDADVSLDAAAGVIEVMLLRDPAGIKPPK